jgi:tRNA 2-thiouridine synthesizing protein C
MIDKKSILIINQSAPYGSSKARESLDVALTCSIFEMPVSLLFIGDGLYQLINNQSPDALSMKKHEAMLSALPMYDIEKIYITEEDLESIGLTENDLAIPVTLIQRDAIASLIQQNDSVLTF